MELENCIAAVDAPLFSYTEKTMALLRGVKGRKVTVSVTLSAEDMVRAKGQLIMVQIREE